MKIAPFKVLYTCILCFNNSNAKIMIRPQSTDGAGFMEAPKGKNELS